MIAALPSSTTAATSVFVRVHPPFRAIDLLNGYPKTARGTPHPVESCISRRSFGVTMALNHVAGERYDCARFCVEHVREAERVARFHAYAEATLLSPS